MSFFADHAERRSPRCGSVLPQELLSNVTARENAQSKVSNRLWTGEQTREHRPTFLQSVPLVIKARGLSALHIGEPASLQKYGGVLSGSLEGYTPWHVDVIKVPGASAHDANI